MQYAKKLIYNSSKFSMSSKFTLRDLLRKGKDTDHSHTCKIDYDVNKPQTRLLELNKQYVEEKTKTDPNYFKTRALTQQPKYLLIGCADSRVPPNEMTKTEPGEIFIHRNVANLVISSDLNCMSTIQYAVEYLKVEHVIVMGHTKCGGILAASKCDHLGLINQWLQHIRDIATIHREQLDHLTDENEFLNKLTELNIRHQALNVCKTPFVQKAWADGRDLKVHAWLCDIETGHIKDLDVVNSDWKLVENYYKIKF